MRPCLSNYVVHNENIRIFICHLHFLLYCFYLIYKIYNDLSNGSGVFSMTDCSRSTGNPGTHVSGITGLLHRRLYFLVDLLSKQV